MHNYSPEDLILYLYKETSPEATAAIEEAIKTDWTLREKLEVLKTSIKRLDSIVTSPRTELILYVMKYASKESEVSKVKS
jgi:hypothetical protein